MGFFSYSNLIDSTAYEAEAINFVIAETPNLAIGSYYAARTIDVLLFQNIPFTELLFCFSSNDNLPPQSTKQTPPYISLP